MDKQKQIEEMEKDIAVRMAMAKGIAGSMNNGVEGWLAEYLIEKGWAKINEGAVVLAGTETTENLIDLLVDFDEMSFTPFTTCPNPDEYAIEWKSKLIYAIGQLRKETAEKFAERQKELEEALLDMVVQFCQMGEYGKLKHAFMSAEEQAFDVLDIKYGEKVDKVYKRFNKKWNRPIDEICKELTEGKE